MTSWEAFAGMIPIKAGKRRNGKPHVVLMMQVLVCTSEADAKRVMKELPGMKFVKRTGRRVLDKGEDTAKEIK